MDRKIPDISVIIPVYKVEAYIERCAKSLFEQTFNNLEYIFVNDCTPDRSMEILRQLLELYPRRMDQVKIIHHSTNKGIAAVRNTGLKQATGKYIGWVDSDDWVETAMFEHLYTVAEKHNSDIVWCDFYNTCTEYEERLSQYCEENNIAFVKALLVGTVHGGLCFSIAKRETYFNYHIRFSDGQNVLEDKLVMIKLLYFSKHIKYVPEAYYHYLKDNSSSITTKWREDLAVQEAAMANLLAMFSFLKHTGWKHELHKYMKYAKLIFKRSLLNSLDMQSFQKWKELFKEENRYVLCCPNMTLRQKILGWSISHGWWFVATIWIRIKKGLTN